MHLVPAATASRDVCDSGAPPLPAARLRVHHSSMGDLPHLHRSSGQGVMFSRGYEMTPPQLAALLRSQGTRAKQMQRVQLPPAKYCRTWMTRMSWVRSGAPPSCARRSRSSSCCAACIAACRLSMYLRQYREQAIADGCAYYTVPWQATAAAPGWWAPVALAAAKAIRCSQGVRVARACVLLAL